MFVLGAINEYYEALYDVRMYVSLSLKVSVNNSQTVRFFLPVTAKKNSLKVLFEKKQK